MWVSLGKLAGRGMFLEFRCLLNEAVFNYIYLYITAQIYKSLHNTCSIHQQIFHNLKKFSDHSY